MKKASQREKMFENWVLNNNNCLAFVLLLFCIIFLLLMIVSFSHWQTAVFCFGVAILCFVLGSYYLSPRSWIVQYKTKE